MGKKFLLTKTLLQSSTALNLAMFLLLKSDESIELDDDMVLDTSAPTSLIQFHPVMKRLEQCNSLAQKLQEKVEKKVPGLKDQLNNLIKASLLMESMRSGEDAGSDQQSDDDDDDDDKESQSEADTNNQDKTDSKPASSDAVNKAQIASSSEDEDESSEDDSDGDEEAFNSRNMVNNARFGLRPNEIAQDKMARSATTTAKRHQRRAAPSDFGDDEDAAADKKMAARNLSSTINSIEQRAASRKKKLGSAAASEALVDHADPDDDLRRGIEMMEAEMGRLSDDEAEGDNSAESINSEGDDGDGFYAQVAKKSKAKRKLKKTLYQVAPKYPRLEAEVEGMLRCIGTREVFPLLSCHF